MEMVKNIFEHYKNKKLYQLICTSAQHTETGEKLAVYRSIEDGRVWARPLDMFNEFVEVDGEQVPRFKHKGTVSCG